MTMVFCRRNYYGSDYFYFVCRFVTFEVFFLFKKERISFLEMGFLVSGKEVVTFFSIVIVFWVVERDLFGIVFVVVFFLSI